MNNQQSDTTARRQIMVFAMGAMGLITLATTVIVGAHYWQMLSGIFLISMIGLTLPDWAAWWATYWHARATKQGEEDTRVSVTCLVVSGIMSIVMILNAGAVLATWWDEKRAIEAQGRTDKASIDSLTVKNAGNTDAIKARGQVVQQMKASGATERTVREYMKAEADRDKVKAINAGEDKPTTSGAAYVSQVPDTVKAYMGFWVYIVPFIVGLFGVFAIIIAVALPGGAEFGAKPQRQTAAMSPPIPAGAAAKQNSTTVSGGGNFSAPRQ